MGIITVKLTVSNPKKPSEKISANFLVDTGAHYTVIPKKFVEKLHLRPSYEQEFALADGRVIKRKIGSAQITFEKRIGAVMVVLGEKDDDALLGITTLESFGLMIDPFKRKLYHSKLMLAKLF